MMESGASEAVAAAVMPPVAPADVPEAEATAAAAPTPTWSFTDFAAQQGMSQFAKLLNDAGLTQFVESCETSLTIFAPTDEAIIQLGDQLPSDTQLLRELLCVHITMGSLR